MPRRLSKFVDWLLSPWRKVPLRNDEIEQIRARYQNANAALLRLARTGVIQMREGDVAHFEDVQAVQAEKHILGEGGR
jgi:hypothetical protein